MVNDSPMTYDALLIAINNALSEIDIPDSFDPYIDDLLADVYNGLCDIQASLLAVVNDRP
jgi:hypothetical protein